LLSNEIENDLNMQNPLPNQCDTLIMLAVSSEEEALKGQAKAMEIEVKKISKHEVLGTYYWLG